jgi:hypothetical protein
MYVTVELVSIAAEAATLALADSPRAIAIARVAAASIEALMRAAALVGLVSIGTSAVMTSAATTIWTKTCGLFLTTAETVCA